MCVARWIRARVTKTKIASTLGREADFCLDFAHGVHPFGGLIQQLVYEGAVLLRDDNTVQHRVVDPDGVVEHHEFDDTKAWTEWVAAHPECLVDRAPAKPKERA